MWEQLHSLIYSLARKLGICFQKAKGLWGCVLILCDLICAVVNDLPHRFGVRWVLCCFYQCLAHGVLKPKALLCSYPITNTYIWKSNAVEPVPAFSSDSLCMLAGFNGTSGHGYSTQGAGGIAFPEVSLSPQQLYI